MRTWRDFKTDTFCSRLVLSHPPPSLSFHSAPFSLQPQAKPFKCCPNSSCSRPSPCCLNVCKAKIPENKPKMQQQIQLQLQLATCLCHLPLYAIATCHICKAFSFRTEYLNNFRLCLFLFFFYFFTFTFATLSCNYKCLMATRNREVPFRWPASTHASPACHALFACPFVQYLPRPVATCQMQKLLTAFAF